jgi:hypothetical protein
VISAPSMSPLSQNDVGITPPLISSLPRQASLFVLSEQFVANAPLKSSHSGFS